MFIQAVLIKKRRIDIKRGFESSPLESHYIIANCVFSSIFGFTIGKIYGESITFDNNLYVRKRIIYEESNNINRNSRKRGGMRTKCQQWYWLETIAPVHFSGTLVGVPISGVAVTVCIWNLHA